MTVISFHSVLTVVFFVSFVALVIWVYLPSRKERYERDACLPFVHEDAGVVKKKEGEDSHE